MNMLAPGQFSLPRSISQSNKLPIEAPSIASIPAQFVPGLTAQNHAQIGGGAFDANASNLQRMYELGHIQLPAAQIPQMHQSVNPPMISQTPRLKAKQLSPMVGPFDLDTNVKRAISVLD